MTYITTDKAVALLVKDLRSSKVLWSVVEHHAEKLVAKLSVEDLKRIAKRYLLDTAKDRSRQEVLRVEQRAMHDTPAIRRKRAQEHDARVKRDNALLGLPEDAGPFERLAVAWKQYEEGLKMQWTAELLTSSFVLADGTRVSWGEASVNQHKERVTLFEGQAAESLEGASRHKAAITLLTQKGAACLNDLAV